MSGQPSGRTRPVHSTRMSDAQALIAQIPNATPGEIGAWLVSAAAIIAIIVLVLTGLNQAKQLRAKPIKVKRPIDERFVTRAEHDRLEKELTERITSGQKSLTDKFDKHEDYTHSRFHELAQQVQNLGLKIAEQPHDTREMIDKALIPLMSKLDIVSTTVTAIAVKVGITPVSDGLVGGDG